MPYPVRYISISCRAHVVHSRYLSTFFYQQPSCGAHSSLQESHSVRLPDSNTAIDNASIFPGELVCPLTLVVFVRPEKQLH